MGFAASWGDAETVLNIRGKRAHEAEKAIEKFLDSLVYRGKKGGTIRHGKSGGTLKALARKMLKEDPRIDNELWARDETGRSSAGAVSFRLL